jgi:hypothetical protein
MVVCVISEATVPLLSEDEYRTVSPMLSAKAVATCGRKLSDGNFYTLKGVIVGRDGDGDGVVVVALNAHDPNSRLKCEMSVDEVMSVSGSSDVKGGVSYVLRGVDVVGGSLRYVGGECSRVFV